MLLEAFESNPAWKSGLVRDLAAKTGLSLNQVYKWGWDHKKKLRLEEGVGESVGFECSEVLYPGTMDSGLWAAQKLFRSQVSMIGGFGIRHFDSIFN